MAKKVSALLVALLILKSIGATDSDTQKVAAIQKRRYFSGAFNNPVLRTVINIISSGGEGLSGRRGLAGPCMMKFRHASIFGRLSDMNERSA